MTDHKVQHTLRMLEDAEPVVITGLKSIEAYQCYICNDYISNKAKVFCISDRDPMYHYTTFFAYVHNNCRTVKMIKLKLAS